MSEVQVLVLPRVRLSRRRERIAVLDTQEIKISGTPKTLMAESGPRDQFMAGDDVL